MKTLEEVRKESMRRSPFLWTWILDEMQRINEMQKPKQHWKPLLILNRVLNPKLELKKFAKEHGLAHGTVKNWISTTTHFKAAEIGTAMKFAELFFNELDKVYQNEADKDKIAEFVKETYYYPDLLKLFLLKKVNKTITEPDLDPFERVTVIAKCYPLMQSIVGEGFDEKMLRTFDELFKQILLLLVTDGTEIEFVKEQISKLIDERTEWKIAYYTKKERRRGKKSTAKTA